jgi:hypothetical protein
VYGGYCACKGCGESHKEFLQIDHIDGSGAEHRKKVKTMNIYQWLKNKGYPRDNFRLLCGNCNWARGVYGYCPHEKENL